MENQLIDVTKLSSDQLLKLAESRKAEEAESFKRQKQAYESIRAEVVHHIEVKVRQFVGDVQSMYDFIKSEALAFKQVMADYGQLRFENQLSFQLQEGDFKIEVKVNKIKAFDERADIAAARLIEFLKGWISNSEKGVNDPMYQLGMTLLERNRQGDLDYKSISKLYQLEADFNSPEYSDIMQLFKESNVVETTATNFYFYERTEMGVWRKLEPNFNRL